MFEKILTYLTLLDEIFWGYIAFVLILALGSFLTFKNKFFQIRHLPHIVQTFLRMMKIGREEKTRGVHPLRAFFASLGAMIGIGNVVGIVTAIQLGGPGALFWVWVAGVMGAIVKYSEIFLGLKYRVPNAQGGYDGGPMYFLSKAFKSSFIPIVVALLLCIYGVEIYQFSVITESVCSNWHMNKYFLIVILLGATLLGGTGGVNRIGRICTWVIPLFIVIYAGMALWIVVSEISFLPHILLTVFKSAFSGHAAVGGFAGSGMILAVQHGIARAAYSADIGIGYDSIIQSESNTVHPQRQACLAIIGVGIDNIICTISILVVLLTGVWSAVDPIPGSRLMQTALSQYFPLMHIFMPLFLVICGYTTLIAYLCIGLKCAQFLWPQQGRKLYLFYASCSLIFFSFFDQGVPLLVMSICGASLLILNLLGIFRLRNHISFSAEELFLKESIFSAEKLN